MRKTKTFFIILFLLIFLNLNVFSKNQNNVTANQKLFIYESPYIDYEIFFIDNKEFLLSNGTIFSVQNDNNLIITSRYYIPIRKIKLLKGDYLLSSSGSNLYLFNKLNGNIYIFFNNKIKFYKKIGKIDVSDFEIYKNNFYFLLKHKILYLNEDLNIHHINLNEIFFKFKIIHDKIFLINNEKLKIIKLNGDIINELKSDSKEFKAFDVNFDERIYIIEKDVLKIFDKDLKILKSIKLSDSPEEIFFDLSRALILYFKNSGIKVLEPQINYRTIDKLQHPSDITIDEEKNIYILSSGGSKVLVYDKNLNFKYSFGENILNHPQGIYYYNGKIYVSDSWNNKVRIFDKNGDLILSFGNFGEKENEFSYPSRIKIIDNKIYILDTYNNKLKIFDLNGNFLNSYGSEPYFWLKSIIKPKDTLFNPMDFFVKDNKVYIIDGYTLIKFDNKIKKYGLNDYITKVISFNDDIYLLGFRWKYIYKFNEKENKIIPVFSIINNYNETRHFIIPYSFTIDENRILILDRTNSKLYIIEGSL
jgi:hypothetical protein